MAQTKSKPNPDALGAQPWRYSWFTRPAAWCVLAWGAGLVLWRLQIPMLWVILGAILAAALAPMVATALDEPLRGRWFHFALWSTLGLYLSWLAGSPAPWSRGAFLAWIPGGGLLGAWWWWVQYAAARDKLKGNDKAAQARQNAERGRYVEMIETALAPKGKRVEPSGLVEIARTPFPAGASYGSTIRLGLPRDGSITPTQLEQVTEKLVTIANARTGSHLFERDHDHGAEILLHVMERDALIETVPLPFNRGPKSINRPFELGRYADGQVCVLTYREVAAMLVGIKGTGKSSLINTAMSHLTGCEDAVVWMIDLKGGETVRPWIEPFLAQTTNRPAVDWVATEEAEAEAMLIALKAAIKHRAKKGDGRGGKWKPAPGSPAIILIVEEASLVSGVGKYANIERAGLLQDVVNTGRSACVDCLVCSQRATVTMLGNGDMKSNLDVRIGMGCNDRTEASMVMPDGAWSKVLSEIKVDEAHRGAFLMQGQAARMMPAKAYWVAEDLIPGMAVSNSSWRPDVDAETVREIEAALSQAGVSGGYAGRWERLRDALDRPLDDADDQAPHPGGEAVPQVPQDGGREASQRGGAAQAVADAIAASRADREAAKFDAEFAKIIAANLVAGDLGEARQDTTGEAALVPPILRHMLAVFGVSDQLPSKFIAETLPGGMTVQRLGRLMGHCGVASIENVLTAEGNRARGYARADVEKARDRALQGQMPRAAFDWQP